MTAAQAIRSAPASGMRAVDPRRDLRGLAELIESVFADSLDATGRRMVDEMRRFGRLGWLGWLLGHLVLPPAAYPDGFVWVDGGRLIGNASLMRVEGAPERWVLANVAVVPRARRQGIARRLVGACLDRADQRGARRVVLQVRSDNPAAIDLYRRFGFVTDGTRATWKRVHAPDAGLDSSRTGARRRRPEEWAEQYELARRLTPEGLVWPHPLRPTLFRPGIGLGGDRWRHWVFPEQGRIQAWLSARLGASGTQWYLVAPPELAGEAQVPLLRQAMRDEGLSERAVWLETTSDDADGAVRAMGFTLEHRLSWMSRPAATGSFRETGGEDDR